MSPKWRKIPPPPPGPPCPRRGGWCLELNCRPPVHSSYNNNIQHYAVVSPAKSSLLAGQAAGMRAGLQSTHRGVKGTGGAISCREIAVDWPCRTPLATARYINPFGHCPIHQHCTYGHNFVLARGNRPNRGSSDAHSQSSTCFSFANNARSSGQSQFVALFSLHSPSTMAVPSPRHSGVKQVEKCLKQKLCCLFLLKRTFSFEFSTLSLVGCELMAA